MKVAVIGASGGMGSFFVRYFLERGAEVRGSDPGEGTKHARGLVSFKTNAEAVRGCDLTILAVPMANTLEVAKEVAGRLKPGSTLVEISSVKGETLPALTKAVGGRANLLSIHPLFGPALESRERMKIAVISKKKGRQEAALAKRLFPEARIIVMGSEEHDRAMAVILSMTHLLNVVYAATAARFLSPDEFKRVSTPNSSMQLALAEAVLAQDARLTYAIQASNPYSREVALEASRELKRVLAMIVGSDWEAFDRHLSSLSKRYKIGKKAGAVMREVYSSTEKSP